MASFQVGQSKPKGSGRKEGTPNKRSQNLAEALDSLNFNIPEKLVQLLPKLSPEKQVDILIDLMGYLYPKRKAIEVELGTLDNGPQVILTMPSNGREVFES